MVGRVRGPFCHSTDCLPHLLTVENLPTDTKYHHRNHAHNNRPQSHNRLCPRYPDKHPVIKSFHPPN
ncbi:hypothetical protein PILCRDRAFT_639738 [Piloderma croceum F 1598]|uniref:Uncharacterized protein n=1 Tax=Piloderma croceum (strain F 1598) TaxID=765440 RepID=A0A0C3FAD8_PILCF|nr:hypothetical protein PILCRDRAFT_639738 [Piloderma croceum F 1598]